MDSLENLNKIPEQKDQTGFDHSWSLLWKFLQRGNGKTGKYYAVSDSAYGYLVDNYKNTESKNIKLI